jgi:hypothetical protein
MFPKTNWREDRARKRISASSQSSKVVTSEKVVALFAGSERTFRLHFTFGWRSSMPPKTPALLRELLERMLCHSSLSAHDLRTLFRNGDCNALQSRNQQIVVLSDDACNECGNTFRCLDLADIFRLSSSRVRNILSKPQKLRRAPSRPLKWAQDQEEAVCRFIRKLPTLVTTQPRGRRSISLSKNFENCYVRVDG